MSVSAMKERASSGGRFVVAFLLFGTTVAITILLLLAALVVWLSQLTGSFIAAALIPGGLFAVVAMLIYLLVVRGAGGVHPPAGRDGLRGGAHRPFGIRVDHREVRLSAAAPRPAAQGLSRSAYEKTGSSRKEFPVFFHWATRRLPDDYLPK